MAQTFDTHGLKATTPGQPSASWLRQNLPKASATAFPIGPIKLASGLVVVWVNPSDADIFAFALKAGVSGDTEVECMYATPDVILEANFLGSAGVDNVLAAADLGLSRDLTKVTDLTSAGDGWCVTDTSSDVAVDIVEFASQQIPPTNVNEAPVAGDTNARIRAHVRPGVSAWY